MSKQHNLIDEIKGAEIADAQLFSDVLLLGLKGGRVCDVRIVDGELRVHVITPGPKGAPSSRSVYRDPFGRKMPTTGT